MLDKNQWLHQSIASIARVSYFKTILPKVTGGYGKGRLASFCLEPTTKAYDLSLLTVKLVWQLERENIKSLKIYWHCTKCTIQIHEKVVQQ